MCSDLQRYFGYVSQNRGAFAAILNVCLSALLDCGHILQHLKPKMLGRAEELMAALHKHGNPCTG